MTTIRVHRHAIEAEPPLEFHAESIGQWLLEHYGASPTGGVFVYAGEPSAETDLTGNVPALLKNDAPLYVVLETPGFTGGALESILLNMLISTVLSVVAQSIFAPEKPLDNRTQESPNNALANRENRVRIMERVEDIFGTVRSIPTLLMPTYSKYIEHRRVEYSLLCPGRGYLELTDFREGDTELAAIDGASAAVYWPFTSPGHGSAVLTIGDPITDPILSVSRSSSLDGIVLKAVNQLQIAADGTYLFLGAPSVGGLVTSSLDVIWQPENRRKPNFAAVTEVGQQVTIAGADPVAATRTATSGTVTVDAGTKTYTATVPLFTAVVDGEPVTVVSTAMDGANTGLKTVVSHTDTVLTIAEAGLVSETVAASVPQPVSFEVMVDVNGTRTVAGVNNGYVELTGPVIFPAFDSGSMTLDLGFPATVTVDNDMTDWTGWFTLPATDRTEVWTNMLARQGMFRDDGSKSTTSVAYEIQIEQLDPGTLAPTGVVETVTGTISGATSAERAETLERVTGWVGPARVRARRTTSFDFDFGGFVQDEITWMDLYAVSPVTKPHFGNKTIIQTVTRATQGATAVSRRELNCLAARLLPVTGDGVTFSGALDADGLLASGTLAATSRIVDILAAVTVDPKIGGRDISELDLAQVWSVQQALDAWHLQAGQFNYTFDSDALSYEETVKAIADAAFCRPYRQNGVIRLALDRPQANSVGLYTHRNKAPDAETITRRFASDSDYDGVELLYVDPETESQETIRLPLDGSATKAKKIEVSGIRSFEQAWLRANREYQRLRFERLSIESTVTTDARALLPNSRVDIVDNTRFRSFDGEVIGQAGLELTLSRAVEFLPSEPHSIVLKKRDGGIQSIAVTAGSAPNKVVLAGAPAEALVTYPDPDEGVRTEFSFAADSARGAQAWLVQELEITDDSYVRLRAVNYSDDYYAADSEAIPPKDSVIN